MRTFQSIAGRTLLKGRICATIMMAAAVSATSARRLGSTTISMYIIRKIMIAMILCIKDSLVYDLFLFLLLKTKRCCTA